MSGYSRWIMSGCNGWVEWIGSLLVVSGWMGTVGGWSQRVGNGLVQWVVDSVGGCRGWVMGWYSGWK